MEGIVKNNSKGYGYNYAQLSDIVEQGYKLPLMTVRLLENGEEYIFYKDDNTAEWLQGAKVVVPESKSMNKAQLYGAALSYARRYTSYMALRLSCQDNEIENLNPDGTTKDAGGEKPTGKATTKAGENTPQNAPKRPAKKAEARPNRDALISFCEQHKLDVMQISKDYNLSGNSSEEDFKNALSFLEEEYK